MCCRAPYANTASSNETANGYFLERSQSARLTLEKACELMPEDEVREMVLALCTVFAEQLLKKTF